MTGFFKRLGDGLAKSRELLGRGFERLAGRHPRVDAGLWVELEELLIGADLGVAAAGRLVSELREKAALQGSVDSEWLKNEVADRLMAILSAKPDDIFPAAPWVVLVVGVNGAGKTTTIAKLAWKATQGGKKVLLAAGDTFRAAAIEQLTIWGGRVGAKVIAHQPGADPSAVAFDAIAATKGRGIDTVFIDTAGRLHTRSNLMEELKKIKRVIGKGLAGAPHETLLVLDATTGQNAFAQARLFHEAVGVTGIALTKLDGTAKGGIVVPIVAELSIPIRYVGVGEAPEDLLAFDPEAYVNGLMGRGKV